MYKDSVFLIGRNVFQKTNVFLIKSINIILDSIETPVLSENLSLIHLKDLSKLLMQLCLQLSTSNNNQFRTHGVQLLERTILLFKHFLEIDRKKVVITKQNISQNLLVDFFT